jgi:3-phenylpropionate/trans-cinnamate dioxygenase ferredoxin reductase component
VIVIVGAGECGARAAITLREQGCAVTLVGAEVPYERPPLSKAVLTADAERATIDLPDVDLVPGVTVTDLDVDDHRLTLADGHTIGYERLLLATGAVARRLPGPHGVHHLRTHHDALALREELTPGARVVVIGGGFIGLELASSAVARGCTVTVVEVAPRLMGRAVPEPVAAVMAARHAGAGVDVRCDTGISRLERSTAGWHLELTTGAALTCDVVVAGIGSVPETALAEKAGLAVENGIRVDGMFATSDPDVFAAGDCCSFPHPLYDGRRMRLESWRAAKDQGTAAANAMLGAGEPYGVVPWFWSDQHDLSLQIAGLPDAAVAEVVRTRPDGVEIRFGLGADGRLLAASAVGPGNTVAKDIRLAEMLIARRSVPDPAALADPAVALKTLLRTR